MESKDAHSHHKRTLAGLLITLGIIYGDIGTSPLYVMRAVVGDTPVHAGSIYGAVSLVFWTLTIQTTLKYVTPVLQVTTTAKAGFSPCTPWFAGAPNGSCFLP
ncbi:MAG: KUP/HAK/KT family potassium transporter [Saprospiraceae bacterium]